MSSQLHASVLARATAADKTLSAKLDVQAVTLRKADSTDAFAQIFASAHKEKEPEPTARPAEPAPERTVTSRHAVHHKAKDSTDKKDNDTADAWQGDDTAPVKDKCATHAEKKQKKEACEAKTAEKSDKVDESDKDAVAATADTVDTTDTQVQAVDAGADQMVDTTPDTTPAACFAPMLKAQEAAANTANDDASKEQDAQPVKTGLQDLLSFRANIGASVKAAGEKSAAPGIDTADAADGVKAPVVKADAAVKDDAGEKTGAEFKLASLAPLEVKKTDAAPGQPQALPQAAAEEATANFSAMLHYTSARKAGNDSRAIAPDPKLEAAASTDTSSPVSPTPPAAGSRVNALMGFPAPTPTGSGSGSPSPAQAAGGNGVEATAGMGALGTAGSVDLNGNLQMMKTAKTSTAPMMEPAQQISISLTRALKNGASSFEVSLTPENLGKVEIKLDISKDGAVRAVVTSDNQATHDMLQKDSGALQKVLQQAGLQTDSGSLSFNLRGETQQEQAAYQQPKVWQRWMDTALSSTAAAPETEYYTVANGRVDMRV